MILEFQNHSRHKQTGYGTEMLGLQFFLRSGILFLTIGQALTKTVSYDLRINYATRYPDGVEKEVIVINDIFPGPTIRAKLGDTLVVRVTNYLRDRFQDTYPTSVHWHGIEMFQEPWWDGPDGITQCAIPYGKSMQYKFALKQAGTYWYHSHHNWQYADGFWGLLIVDNTKDVYAESYDKEFAIPLIDWYHTPSKRLANCYEHRDIGPVVPDSGLINGQGSYPCSLPKSIGNSNCQECEPDKQSQTQPSSSPRPQFHGSTYNPFYLFEDDDSSSEEEESSSEESSEKYITPRPNPKPFCMYVCDPRKQSTPVYNVIRGLTYRLRLISTSARANFNFSIDGHKLTVIETDGVDTVPVGPVDAITIWPAQRYSVLVTMNGDKTIENFWIRANMSSLAPGVSQPKAILRYKKFREYSNIALSQDSGMNTQNTATGITEQPIYTTAKGSVQGRLWAHNFDWSQYNEASITAENEILVLGDSLQISNKDAESDISSNFMFASANRHSSLQIPMTLPPANLTYLDENLCKPYASSTAPKYYEELVTINSNILNSTNRLLAQINNNRFTPNTGLPFILQMRQPQGVSPTWNPVFSPSFSKVVQVVINNQHTAAHPWHLHGHSFWVLGTGEANAGNYIESRDSRKLKFDGVRRDTTHTNPKSWAVIRYVADNPGAWLFHCHINWHSDIGLAAVFIEGQSQLKKLKIPEETKRLCAYNNIKVQ